MVMAAVAELAEGAKFGDLGEQNLYAIGRVADVKGTHSRRIDHPAAAGDGVQRTRGRGVASLGIVLADFSGLLRQGLRGTSQGIYQRRFAYPR